MLRRQVLAGCAAILLSGAPAFAECRTGSFRFFPAQNDSVTAYTTLSGSCLHNFTTSSSLSFTSAEIVSRPSHGSLNQTGAFAFRYVPTKGYRGADSYAVKVCANARSGSGCSRITYQATVQ